jgi:glyoxylase-like metal-dependent hydrolase (beta-lactamase superfamily II)
MTKLISIKAGTFKLDGGAMFGVVPRVLWEKLNPPDARNLCLWALRCLLVDTGDRRILIDAGIGTKQDAKFMSHFRPSPHLLKENLATAGYPVESVTDVFLTHLHFDHCGGALEYDPSGDIVPVFPNAAYWSCKSHLDWAMDPNPRERASFLKENIAPLVDQGVLRHIPEEQDYLWQEGIRVRFTYGHTHAMMIPRIPYKGTVVSFCADLLPSSYHVGMPYVMSYDIRPLSTLEEKARFFQETTDGRHVLFLEHDPVHECIRLARDERGRYIVDTYLTLDEI